jgi:hypothetical protein
MRSSTLIKAMAVAAAWAVAAPASSSAARKPPPRCPPARAKVIVADRLAAVYKAPGPPQDGEEGFVTVFACAHGHRRYTLGEPAEFGPEGGGGVASERLAGTMVAYEQSRVEGSSEPGHVHRVIFVRNLLTGRVVHEAATAQAKFAGDVGKGSAEKIVLKRDGSVAWIVQTERDPDELQVHAVDRTGSRLLAAAADIAPGSLTLKGSTLRWIEGGKPAYAILH